MGSAVVSLNIQLQSEGAVIFAIAGDAKWRDGVWWVKLQTDAGTVFIGL